MSAAPTRLLFLGIDAASPELLDRWTADGTLPNLAALAARGTVARTRGVDGFFVGSTWPSLYTGTTPARHGVHYLVQLEPGSYRLYESAHGDFVRTPPFWRALHAAGLRQAILDVPLTRLEPALRGVQVVEWGGHDALYGFRAHPASLADELRARHGLHPQESVCDAHRRTAADHAAFLDRLSLAVERKAAWTRELLAQGGWDLFMQVFTEAHCAGHQCWHLHDASHPAHDPAVAAELGDPLRRIYQAIDRAVGAVVADAGDATVIVFSAHGMAHWYGAQFLLHDILARLGACVPLPPAPPRTGARVLLRRGVSAVARRLPEPIRAPLRALRDRVSPPPPPVRTIRADLARSRCFPHANGLAVGGIRLNLAGREPQGVLQPSEADAFVAWLSRELLAVTDASTGRPLVRRVVRTRELYDGPQLDHLPDLLVEWSDETATGSAALAGGAAATVRATSPAIGLVEGRNDYGRTGEHRPGGWLVAAGAGIAPGRLAREPSLLDVAPTVAALLGVPLPECDGRPIPEIAGAAAPPAARE